MAKETLDARKRQIRTLTVSLKQLQHAPSLAGILVIVFYLPLALPLFSVFVPRSDSLFFLHLSLCLSLSLSLSLSLFPRASDCLSLSLYPARSSFLRSGCVEKNKG